LLNNSPVSKKLQKYDKQLTRTIESLKIPLLRLFRADKTLPEGRRLTSHLQYRKAGVTVLLKNGKTRSILRDLFENQPGY
jgi:hypothetical protein